MVGLIALALVLGLPVALGLLLRVSAPHLFFSVMAGELLARYFGSGVQPAVQSLLGNQAAEYSQVAILVLPILATALLLRQSLRKGRLILHLLPWVVTGVVLGAFALPLLPLSIQDQIRRLELGHQLLDINSLIIGGVVILQLSALWVINRRRGRAKYSSE